MTANTRIDSLNKVFDQQPTMDHDGPFATPQRPGGVFRLPSHRSGFAAHDDTESEVSSNAPDSPWSPPAVASAWYRHQSYLQDSPMARSTGRGSASVHDGARSARQSASVMEDDIAPANIPLPRGSESPFKERSPEPQLGSRADSRHSSPVKVDSSRFANHIEDEGDGAPDKMANYIRFSVRADVQQRTEPIEHAIVWLRSSWRRLTRSKTRIVLSALAVLMLSSLIRFLFTPPDAGQSPDLIKAASMARSFEPLIHFSEHGVRQLSDLQETGTAVWDLSESVRVANLTSSPIIVTELESLYDSLTGLATELTGFFAAVDGDFDSILMVMDWARRELAQVMSLPDSPLSSVIGNLHTGLTAVGLLSSTDARDPRNIVFAGIFGVPSSQRAFMALRGTFMELLSTLEQSIESELVHAQALFSLYAAIDRRFLNLQRATVRETDMQESLESEVLSSLWQRALGARAGQLRKFEKNKKLLGAVRQRTLLNKNMLLEHNGRLTALKQNLEMLRRHLVSPLLKEPESMSGVSTPAPLSEQVKQLGETADYLRKVRQEQKEKVLETLYGAGRKKMTLEIEGL